MPRETSTPIHGRGGVGQLPKKAGRIGSEREADTKNDCFTNIFKKQRREMGLAKRKVKKNHDPGKKTVVENVRTRIRNRLRGRQHQVR